jgi:thioredoxin 1
MVTLLDFYATWCGPCKMMDPILDEVEGELKDKMKIEKVDVDAQTDRAAEFGVMSIPTYVVMKDDKEVGRMIGYVPKAEFKKKLETYLN